MTQFSEATLERMRAAARLADEQKDRAGESSVTHVVNTTPIMTCKVTSGPDGTGLYTGRIAARVNATTYELGEEDVRLRPASLGAALSTAPYYACRPSHEEVVAGAPVGVYLVYPLDQAFARAGAGPASAPCGSVAATLVTPSGDCGWADGPAARLAPLNAAAPLFIEDNIYPCWLRGLVGGVPLYAAEGHVKRVVMIQSVVVCVGGVLTHTKTFEYHYVAGYEAVP